jgi:uncharacterized protein (DUF885 family)
MINACALREIRMANAFRTALTAVLVWAASWAAAAEIKSTATDVAKLAEEFVTARLSFEPLDGYPTGLEPPSHARFSDHSPASLRAFDKKEDALLAQLNRIPRESISSVDKPTAALLREAIESDQQMRVCKPELWAVSHFTGWQTLFPEIASLQPVGDAAKRADALKRWGSLPKFLDTEIANLREGLQQGYSSPKPVVTRVIQQLDGMLAAPIEESPFLSPAARDEDTAFKKQYRAVIEQKINPAIKRYRDYLQNEYLPKARDTLAVSALPNGAACYQAFLRAFTTLNRTPKEVYDLGERTVSENAAVVAELGSKLYGTRDVPTIVKRNNEAPENQFKSAEESLAYSRDLLQVALEKSRPLFVKLPDQSVVLEIMPAYEDDSGMSANYMQSADRAKPGRYMFPFKRWQSERRGLSEITLVHETVPGHHLQIALAMERAAPTRISKLVANSAYIEGWARYAERLSDEVGIYRTDFARISRRIWPARGMVVDPGIHAFGWSREKAAQYLVSTGRFDEKTAEDTVDRIATMPGQLTSYDTGGLEFFALRKEAEEALGPAFDIRQFHQTALEEGAVPLQELREHVRGWIAATRAPGAPAR